MHYLVSPHPGVRYLSRRQGHLSGAEERSRPRHAYLSSRPACDALRDGYREVGRLAQLTTKCAELLTVPAGAAVLVTLIEPVVAPLGTVAFSFVEDT